MSTEFDPIEYSNQLSEQLSKDFDKFVLATIQKQLQEAKVRQTHITIDQIKTIMNNQETIQISHLLDGISKIQNHFTEKILTETIKKLSPIIKDKLDKLHNNTITIENESKEINPKIHKENTYTPEITTNENEDIETVISNKITDEKFEHIHACIENDMTDKDIEKTTKVSKDIIAHIRKNY